MKNWSWFRDMGSCAHVVTHNAKVDYHEIAKNRALAISNLVTNPTLLFAVVDHESTCLCGGECGNHEYHDITFFDLLVKYYTITEDDLIRLYERGIHNAWFQISSRVPLSNETLLRFKKVVDWKSIIEQSFYNIDAEFIRLFHDKIPWHLLSKYRGNLHVSSDEARKLIFDENIFQLQHALRLKLLTEEHLQMYGAYLGPYCKEIIEQYGPKVLETIDYVEEIHVTPHANLFVKRCCDYTYVPQKFPGLIGRATLQEVVSFVSRCNPCSSFLETYVIQVHDTKEIWRAISKNPNLSEDFIERYTDKLDWASVMQWKQFQGDLLLDKIGKVPFEVISRYQKLTPEFIDDHADVLDWYSLCEYQDLTEELMEKHVDKLNWGQVSLYQKMSPHFIQKHKDKLNELKLAKNLYTWRHCR